ncbi:hypothetical protein A0H81_00127 [Grifola frondosa]|uniref:Uncharacterized protein n=1 Tax=Grifola frondosa TaxID=5627 RepID=A0A1C7MSP8_GRIFR|nr:hypothetical protein A0H81_00127 [Grifola frondosa]
MLPRLFIPPSLNSQQPMSFAEGAPMFAAGLPSSIQQSYHPPFAMHHNPLQTPMQPAFFPQPPGAPGRPALHRSHPSVAQLAAAGILPPPGIPMTPLVDVFLPGKTAWDTIKRSIIEEKLEKLGVERGSGSSVPHILAPHARAASEPDWRRGSGRRRSDLDEVVGEWTGSEDLHTAETSEDESIGEWSNPSDEERARQERCIGA